MTYRKLKDTKWLIVTKMVAYLMLFWAAAPKGSMTYAFTHGEISPSSPSSSAYPPLALETQLSALRAISQPRGPDSIPENKIPASRPKPLSQGRNSSLTAQFSASRPKLSLKAKIPASRPKSQPQGPIPSLKAEIPASCTNSSPRVQIPALWPKSQFKGPNPNR